MAEQFLTLMADFDERSQKTMGEWYEQLKDKGFTGTQTVGLPFHISLGTFPLEKEQEVIREMYRLAESIDSISVHISHIGVFAGGRVLFCGPDMNQPDLLSIRNAIKLEMNENYPWTPHATILIDEKEVICKAVSVLLDSFYPFVGKITRLHLCAFWPTREIAAVELK